VRQFAACWDEGDAKLLDGFVQPEHGLWIVYNVGVAPYAYHFSNLSGPLEEQDGSGMMGFGCIGCPGFQCRPAPGSHGGYRNCDGEAILSSCRFGVARLPLAQLLEDRIEGGDLGEPAEREQLRQLARSAQDRVTGFLSDSQLGAVFYFGRVRGLWWLEAVSTADCSA
jgi:hypothetical protein